MVSLFTSSVVDREFDSRIGQTKDYEIGICCFSAKYTMFRSKSKDRSALKSKIMCPSGATCSPTDCCFSKMCWSSTKQTSSSFHRL